MGFTFEKLLDRMRELKDLSGIIGLATWDQETYLPPKAEPARGQQLSTLQGLYHERLTAPSLGELLDEASQNAALDSDQRAMVRVLQWERGRAIRVPLALVRALAEAQSRALSAWKGARQARDFSLFLPALDRLLRIRRDQADAIGHRGERYDALLEGHEPGMTVARLTPVLAALKDHLVPMVQKLSAKIDPTPDLFTGRTFDVDRQWRFTLRVLEDMGFDLQAGRQDRSIHPFTGGTHPTDVRLTTRLDPDNPLPGIFGTLHEGGHGLYEQGYRPEHYRTPLAAAPSMGLHESQSRLWENLVGRSRGFWQHYHPLLQVEFGEALEGISLDSFHRAMNQVRPTFIRVEADEVTYNLHIVLRYELELLLIRGELPLEELPGQWNDRTQALLGIRPKHDAEGVLQDIHWAWGEFGYFPTYALGNLYAASLYAAARRELPDLEADIAQGQFRLLVQWLRQRVHGEGFRHAAEDLVKNASGRGLTDEDFVAHLRGKYSALYGLAL